MTFARQVHRLAFAVHYLANNRGGWSARGGLTGDPDTPREVLRQGRVQLTLDNGQALNISIAVHAQGSQTAFFESVADVR